MNMRQLVLFFSLLVSYAACALENLALEKTVSASVNRQEASNCVSSNKAARSIGWRVTVKTPECQYLTVDLGEAMNVGAVVLRWTKWPVAYRLAVSKDGKKFKEVARAEGVHASAQGFGFPTEKARWVRLTVEDGSPTFKHAVFLNFFEVYEY